MAGAMVAALRFGSGVEVAVVAGLKNKPMDAVDTAMAATRANLSSNRQAGAVNNVFLPDGPPSVALRMTRRGRVHLSRRRGGVRPCR